MPCGDWKTLSVNPAVNAYLFRILLRKYLVLEIATTKSHIDRLNRIKPIPGRLCWTEPIPGIGYVGQNLFLVYVMLEKPNSGIDYVG